MNKYPFFIFCLCAFLSLAGCSDNNSHPDIDTTLINTSTPEAAPLADTTLAPVISSPTPTGTTNPAPGLAINPPHGQPGHDCAIAVGAPLNGQPNPTPPSSNPSIINTPQNIPAPIGGAAKLNPPHGQPGHDCAIPVGQPLS